MSVDGAPRIVTALRTPVGKRGRSLAPVHPAELLGDLMRRTLDEAGLAPDRVDQVLTGCVTQVGDQAYNIGRMAWLTAGLSPEVPATTLDAQCGSSHQAVNIAAALIASGTAEVVLASGIELMSRHPLGSNVAGGDGEPMGSAYRERYEVIDQGESAERIADKWGIDREECDDIGLRSQQLAASAWAEGRFDDEVRAVDLPSAARDGERVRLERDETFRSTDRTALAGLKPAFRPDGGRLTAGNSSQISDGAACVLLASPAAAQRLDLAPLAALTHQSFVGVDPVLKLTGPIPATHAVLARAGMSVSDIHRFEVNEAFATVIGAWLREIEAPLERVNVNGGAIALGHPVGATGARLVTTMVHELRRRGGGRGIVTMCCGGGLGTASVVEALDDRA